VGRIRQQSKASYLAAEQGLSPRVHKGIALAFVDMRKKSRTIADVAAKRSERSPAGATVRTEADPGNTIQL
jgi:hypothetical protein